MTTLWLRPAPRPRPSRWEGLVDRLDPNYLIRLLSGVVLLIGLLIGLRGLLIAVDLNALRPFGNLVEFLNRVKLVDVVK